MGPYGDAASQLILMSRLRACHCRETIINLDCGVEGETEACHLIAFMARCQDNYTLENIEIYIKLSPVERAEILSVLQRYKQLFSSKPELTYLLTHEITKLVHKV